MKVVITGGAGYLGVPLCERLLAKGHSITILDEFLHNSPELLQEHFASIVAKTGKGAFTITKEDIRSIKAQHQVVQGADAVIHLASLVGDPQCGRFSEDTYQINQQAMRALIETCEHHNIKKFIFASTCSVYGSREGVSDEITPVNPISLYARSKVEGEELLQHSTLSWTILRCGTLYGISKRMRFDLLVNLMSARAAQGETITIFGGDQWRPNVHVEDCAEAFVQALESSRPVSHRQIYNVVHENLPIAVIAQHIADVIPTTIKTEAVAVDMRDYRSSNKRILGILQWQPKYTIKDAARQIKEFFAQEGLNYNDMRFHNYRRDIDEKYAEILRTGEYDKL